MAAEIKRSRNFKHKASFLLVILAFIAEIIPCASQSRYRFQHLTGKDGLASEFAYSIAQDSLGYLWIQYPFGLTRYDGYDFKVYKHDPDNREKSLLNTVLGRIRTDPSGKLWINVHTQEQGGIILTKYDSKSDSFLKFYPDVERSIVSAITFENKGPLIWLGTRGGRALYSFDPGTGRTKKYINNLSDLTAHQYTNTIFSIIDRDSLLLLSTNRGLWQFDKRRKHFSRPPCLARDSALLHGAPILTIHDEKDEIWLILEKELVKLSKDLNVLRRVDFPESFKLSSDDRDLLVSTYDRDKAGIFWFATRSSGLYRFDPGTYVFTNIASSPEDEYSLPSNNLNDIIVDKDQNVWVATHRGISRLTKQSVNFYNVELDAGRIDVSMVYRTSEKDYVLITKTKNGIDHDVMISPIETGRFDAVRFTTLTSIRGVEISGFYQGQKHVWISSYGEGVIGLPINQKTGMIEKGPQVLIRHDPRNLNTIESNLTLGILEDRKQNLWICTRGGGLQKVILNIPYGNTGSVVKYKHVGKDTTSIASDIVWSIHPNNDQSFWVLSNSGLDLYRNNVFHHITGTERFPSSFNMATDGKISIGAPTFYEGEANEGSYTFKPIESLGNEDVVAIREDRLGRLWISSTKGIVCYDQKIPIAIEFNELDGFGHPRAINVFTKGNETSDGVFVINDMDGLTFFDPLSLQINRSKTYPVLTGLMINNRDASIDGNNGNDLAIGRNISQLSELELDYLHNNFSLVFSGMELTAPEKNRYRHRLIGYDQDWIETDWKNRTATYTNLDPGYYEFKAQSTNYHGIWSDQEASLTIHVLPPPWRSWWAYTLYAIALFGAIILWRRYDIKRIILKNRAAQLSELDVLKSQFFANISHEFRTPITLILGPLSDMYNRIANEDGKVVLASAIKNCQRLLRLVNQLLDVSKIESGKMKLHSVEIDIVEFVRETVSSYESLADIKKIKYVFHSEMIQLRAYVDLDKLEKILHNILSNAFKFTKEGGEIVVYIRSSEDSVMISVADTGIGIPANQLDKVFDRFYQVDSSQTRGYEGTGLGMALAKDLVQLHQGKISVQSIQGKGTTFTVSLPLGNSHLRKDEITDLSLYKVMETVTSNEVIPESQSIESGVTLSTGHPLILVVEDNQDMRSYIRKSLSEFYIISEASNGLDGLEIIKDTVPDLVISDVMMPGIDGFQLCEKIKTNELTCHIPVILLTAKADRESKLKGLKTGADDYLSKPFDSEELRLIVKNRIEESRKMREAFSREIRLEPSAIQVSSLDERFIHKILSLIESHIEDESFSIEGFSAEAGYSRMQLYRKIKSLTGQTPSQFVRTIRLKRAAQLLTNNSDNVTQIAYCVGFRSLAYFNKCFKDQFGVTPGQFAQTKTPDT